MRLVIVLLALAAAGCGCPAPPAPPPTIPATRMARCDGPRLTTPCRNHDPVIP